MHAEMFSLLLSQDHNVGRSAISTPTHLPAVTGHKPTDVANSKHSTIISQTKKNLMAMAYKSSIFKKQYMWLPFVLPFKVLHSYNQVLCLLHKREGQEPCFVLYFFQWKFKG